MDISLVHTWRYCCADTTRNLTREFSDLQQCISESTENSGIPCSLASRSKARTCGFPCMSCVVLKLAKFKEVR